MEEETKTTKQLIEDQIKICIGGLAYVEQGGEQHTRLVNDIQRLTAAYAELDKLEYDQRDSDRKFLEEIRQKDLERDYNDMLERDRLVEQKKANKIDAVIKTAGIVIPTVLYTFFLNVGMHLEFADMGSVTGYTVKELFRALAPKQKPM